MKLKRILSLALSGVLAVSMLTACGMGSNLSNAVNRSSAVASDLNGAVAGVSFRTNDSKLNDAVTAIAGSLTASQAKENGAVDSGTIQATALQVTGYDDMDITGAWTARQDGEEHKFVKIFVFDAENSAYDTLGEATKVVSDAFNKMKLEEGQATASATTTNSYKGYVSAYEVEVGTEDAPASAWVIGVSLIQTVTAK